MKKPVYKDKTPNFEELSSKIVEQINKVRSDPKSYIEILENDKTYFKDDILYRPNEDPLRTKEGPSAHDEAIEFLKEQESQDELTLDDRLTSACKDHVEDIGPKGLISHEGSKKETISDRVEKYGEWDYFLCQNIDFGSRNANEFIIAFLTGDGDSTRTHRKNFFKPDIKYIGLASGEHKEAETCTVIAYAGNVRDLNTVAPEVRDFVSNHMKKCEEEKKNPKPKKIKTKFQLDDPDAPDTAISYTTFKKMKLVEGRAKHCTQKVYTLEDGTQHIVEVLDDLKKISKVKSEEK